MTFFRHSSSHHFVATPRRPSLRAHHGQGGPDPRVARHAQRSAGAQPVRYVARGTRSTADTGAAIPASRGPGRVPPGKAARDGREAAVRALYPVEWRRAHGRAGAFR
eukprot:3369604-Prymnesium_polylepis.1